MESNKVDHANPYTNQIFQEAVIRNDIAVVKLLLKYGIYPRRNERNRQGLTALQQSVLDGNGKMSIHLLEAGADIEAKTSNGWTCLHIASALGDLDILTTMINHCADLIALTKNEELPIDLAATRDIKIKLAKEMTRVGYSELAQWYMRKLAAREGVFYVLSTDTLLDLACDDNYDKSYSEAYPYYLPHCNDQSEMYVHSPAHNEQNNALWSRQEGESKRLTEPENTTYLTCSSGYISEAVLNHTSGEYTRVRNSVSVSSSGSPQRKLVASTTDGMTTAKSMGSISEDTYSIDTLPRSGTLKRSGSNKRNSQQMQRKPSKIELHIDYTNSTEDDADDEDAEMESSIRIPTIMTEGVTVLPSSNVSSGLTSSIYQQSSDKSDKYVGTNASHLPSDTRVELDTRANDTRVVDVDTRNVRFDNVDSPDEFCGCPNCKKMGYAYSPDIRASSRKIMHLDQQALMFSPEKRLRYPAGNYMHPQYYPATTTNDKHAIYFGEEGKPRKRKKKLFSGIKSMFKDSIRVHRTTDHSPVVDDAGILFAVSVRESGKAKTIRQRHVVRKSNSFSGDRSEYLSEEVNVFPHNHVVPPPVNFSDSASQETTRQQVYYEHDPSEHDVYETTQWIEYLRTGKEDHFRQISQEVPVMQQHIPMMQQHPDNYTTEDYNEFYYAYKRNEESSKTFINPNLMDSKLDTTVSSHNPSKVDDKVRNYYMLQNAPERHYIEGTM